MQRVSYRKMQKARKQKRRRRVDGVGYDVFNEEKREGQQTARTLNVKQRIVLKNSISIVIKTPEQQQRSRCNSIPDLMRPDGNGSVHNYFTQSKSNKWVKKNELLWSLI